MRFLHEVKSKALYESNTLIMRKVISLHNNLEIYKFISPIKFYCTESCFMWQIPSTGKRT